jgi:hypothetical protein
LLLIKVARSLKSTNSATRILLRPIDHFHLGAAGVAGTHSGPVGISIGISLNDLPDETRAELLSAEAREPSAAAMAQPGDFARWPAA